MKKMKELDNGFIWKKEEKCLPGLSFLQAE